MRLYRYLDKKYIDQFFADGSLMISTLERCRGLEGTDVRGGAGEGTFSSEFRGRYPSTPPMNILQYSPIGTMVLCCSSVHSCEL